MTTDDQQAFEWWWQRDDLLYRQQRLYFQNRDVAAFAAAAGTPVYLYGAARIAANVQRLRETLLALGVCHRIYYAMKANRYTPLLTWLKTLGWCGVDVCSPGELRLALQCGFNETEISYTGTAVADHDLAILAQYPEVWVNCDSISMIRRLGECSPGRCIGLRINPAFGLSYHDSQLLRYADHDQTTKFGIYREHFKEALALANRYGLVVQGIHFHAGSGYLNQQLEFWDQVLESAHWFLDQLTSPRLVNLGGGMGVPLMAHDESLDLHRWGEIVGRHFAHSDLCVAVEPGNYLVKDAGLLILQVTHVEYKRNRWFVGVDGGFNLYHEPAFYQLPCQPIACCLRQEITTSNQPTISRQPLTIMGNINEALDLWAENVVLPGIQEGDYLALLNAGAYASAMMSNHCVRGEVNEYLLF
jgi:diaminopimelate decarboxylase